MVGKTWNRKWWLYHFKERRWS